MAITTYLSTARATSWRKELDAELIDLLDDMIEESREEWAIQPITVSVGHFWWRQLEKRYIIYRLVNLHEIQLPEDFHEWQVINFYVEDSGTSINTIVKRDLVLAYTYGYLGGIKAKGKTNGKKT